MAGNTYSFESDQIRLSPDNPYFGGTIYNYDDGTAELVREPVEWEGTESDDTKRVGLQDSPHKIAHEKYEDETSIPSRYWWLITDVNIVDNPLSLLDRVNEYFIIPSFSAFKLLQNSES